MARALFPRRCRLTKTDEYSSVFSFRKTLKSRHFLLHYRIRRTEEPEGARLGVVVAKRFLPRAVDRNLIRRLARECFRQMQTTLPSRDIVLRLGVRPAALDRRSLADEIRQVLMRLVS